MRPPWRRHPDDEDPPAAAELDEEADAGAAAPIELELTDVLDLHSFPPREIAELVRDYLDVAVERGWPQVRIVHGKGAGVQRERVRSILGGDPRVEAFGDAPGEAGGWGATWARLRPVAAPAPARDER